MILLYNKTTNLIDKIPERDVLYNIYFQSHRLPTQKQLDDANITDVTSDEIKDKISTIDYKIPLYDEYTRNMYIINSEQVYDKIIYGYYRFPNKDIIEMLTKRKDDIAVRTAKASDSDGDHFFEDSYPKKKIRKLELVLDFMNQFNIDLLQKTFENVFYYHSEFVNKNLTNCPRPSFQTKFKHIRPYYTKTELINLGLNMEIITENSNYPSNNDSIKKLCNIISQNDVSADVLIEHYNYIINSGKTGLLQYYTLQGSGHINRYLRNPVAYRNDFLEKIIGAFYEVLDSSPGFDKPYILYRFINDDTHLRHLKIGDLYELKGAESYSRDPFFSKSKLYQFGFKLIKLKVPANTTGVCLSVEGISHYNSEEEMLVCPGVRLVLKSKNNDVAYYRADDSVGNLIITKYEFEYLSKIKYKPSLVRPLPSPLYLVDFIELSWESRPITFAEKMMYFSKTYGGELNQISTMIGDTVYIVKIESYNSVHETWARFFAVENLNGYFMYTMIHDNIGFSIELGELKEKPYMHVNYYFRFSSTPVVNKIKDEDLIAFVSAVAYYFGITKVIIHCEYRYCKFLYSAEKSKKTHMGGNYCVDIYNFYKKGEIRYVTTNTKKGLANTDIKSDYNAYHLTQLRTTSIEHIFNDNDRGELYQLYNTIYLPTKLPNNTADFYVWLVDNYCSFVNEFIDKIDYVYPDSNPFKHDSYTLDPYSYLYNNGIIMEYYGKEDNPINDILFSRGEYSVRDRENTRIRETVNDSFDDYY